MTTGTLFGFYHQRRIYYTPPVWLFEDRPDSDRYTDAASLAHCLAAIDGGGESDDDKPLTALIVEDDPDLSTIFGTAASHAGFDVATVENLQDAQQHLDSKNPQLITLDVYLPDGHGTTVLERIRRENRTTFVILITFDAQVAETTSQADLVLIKPILFTQLRDTMSHIRKLL